MTSALLSVERLHFVKDASSNMKIHSQMTPAKGPGSKGVQEGWSRLLFCPLTEPYTVKRGDSLTLATDPQMTLAKSQEEAAEELHKMLILLLCPSMEPRILEEVTVQV